MGSFFNFLCAKFGNHCNHQILEHCVDHKRVRVKNEKLVGRRSVENELTLNEDNAGGQRNAFEVVEAQF